jgi:hypothetical protein
VSEPAWKATNRAHWDEKVSLHLGLRGYDLTRMRAGHGRFNAVEEAELWPVDGSRVLHLQCHFGSDSLKFAQRVPRWSDWTSRHPLSTLRVSCQ